ncbi:MAG: 2-oxoacid:ferredoxin oxidoreductase subunit beta [Peptococcaceae bacterium]|nr:2-oxoacid:ferredoxin oxidoreductase subunit beta [Peptococcaceae bacterium]
MPETEYKRYLAAERLPHLWCAGCGHGTILKALLLTLAELNIPREKALLATGIGCSGRAGDYVSFHRFQGTHGRTLAFATGIKLARPELTVLCLMGDGDCAAIGAGHLVHAARRNIDLTAIVANNFNYGMTGGQFSPLTPEKAVSSTSRSGKAGPDLDICRLAEVCGANYVARTTAWHVAEMRQFFREAVLKKGFSLVEVLTPCPTYYGRYNRLGGAAEMLEQLKEKAVPLQKYGEMDAAERASFTWRGRLTDRDRPDFLSRYREVHDIAE